MGDITVVDVVVLVVGVAYLAAGLWWTKKEMDKE